MPHKDPIAKKAYLKKYHAEWYKKNKEKRNAQIIEYEKNQPKEWRKSIGQKHHLKTRYNLTPDEYNDLAIKQDYKCAICNKDVKDNIRNGKSIALSVDHKHSTGKIRKLLCFNCNTGLGKFNDDSEMLIKASQYLLSN
jgi:ABC-type Fe3+/spermidine/putrescine transport system ATPase subunit